MLIDLIDFELKFNSSFEEMCLVCMCCECKNEAGVVILSENFEVRLKNLRVCKKNEDFRKFEGSQ